jgi:DNA processing protein
MHFLCFHTRFHVVHNDLLYQIALSLVPQIGPVQARILNSHFGDAVSIFNARISQLKNIEGIGEVRAAAVKKFSGFPEAEKEIRFIEKYNIQPLFISNKDYPQRLLNCYDAPLLLYYKGTASLNVSKTIAVIGTRNHTEYGRHLTEHLIKDLAGRDILVISGLAYGIDALAHKAALKNNLQTVGVLAHGLDQVYPPQHASLAKDILKEGGLLTEFRSGTNPDKHNFPIRNRIVAGISDATIVIETGVKGGSMITAELANGYNKDVFAFPGKVTDSKSAGCNFLVKNNKAMLLENAAELCEIMGWTENKKKPGARQQQLFVDLSKEERAVVAILSEKDAVHIDDINLKSGLSSSTVAAAILSLELQHLVSSLPGKRYCLL